MKEISFKPIGIFKSEQKEPYQAARQPDENSLPGAIELEKGHNFEQGLTDLESCSHIWILYLFHHNSNWKPLVQTPRSDKKIGVFATRAPYRPNPIGMTVVELISVQGLTLEVGPNDILDGTPILDIKPYHPESDLVENSRIGWLETSASKKYSVAFSPIAQDHLGFLQSHGEKEIQAFIERQLQYDPTNSDKKRVQEENSYWTLSYRTWRIDFLLSEESVAVIGLRTGYSNEDLAESEDQYKDKDLHRKFLAYIG